MHKLSETFVALGANMGNALITLQMAAKAIAAHPNVQQFSISNFYLTSPVGLLPQDPYINAVCRLNTSLSLHDFFDFLQQIERQFGKIATNKNFTFPLKLDQTESTPRPLDLDLLFFGTESFKSEDLIVPHPDWKNRLFVLRPLQDLTNEIVLPSDGKADGEIFDLQIYMQTFINPYCEVIHRLN